MKVLMITPYFYPKPGGLEHYAYAIAIGLKQRGHQVVIITSNHVSKTRSQETINGLIVYRLPRQAKLSNTPVSLEWKRSIKAIIEAEKPDIINAHTPVPFMADAAERSRGAVPFVLTYHNDLAKASLLGKSLSKAAYAVGITRTLRQADAIIATSAQYAHASPNLRPFGDKTHIVTPGVDTQQFNTEVSRTWLKQRYGSKFTVLFTGQLDKTHQHKGLPVLLRAMAVVSRQCEAQLLVVGKGDNLSAYKAEANALGVPTTFAGYVEDKDLPKYFAGADVTVLPSTSRSEGFGMVLLEASACARPTIGSDIGGIPQALVNQKTGLLVPPGDISALATAIIRIHDHPELAKSLGAAGAVRIRKDFDWALLTRQTETIFEQVIKSRIAAPLGVGGAM